MAFSAPVLFDDGSAVLWRPGNLGSISASLFSAGTSGKQSARRGNETKNPQIDAHIRVGCEIVLRSLSRAVLLEARSMALEYNSEQAVQRSHPDVRCRWIKALSMAPIAAVVGLLLVVVPCMGQQGSSTPPDGKQIFLEHCAVCHGQHGEGISAAVSYAGPSLQAEHNPGKVMTAVEVGPEHMPRFEYILSVEQMRAVADYVTQNLAVIPLTGGNLADGGELFRTYCATCHRTAVRGGALGFVGTNAPSLAQKSPELIAGAIRWGPGPMPKFPPSELSDEQVASIVQYIQTVQHPANPGGDPLHWYGPTSEGAAAWVIVLLLILFAMWAERGGQG